MHFFSVGGQLAVDIYESHRYYNSIHMFDELPLHGLVFRVWSSPTVDVSCIVDIFITDPYERLERDQFTADGGIPQVLHAF